MPFDPNEATRPKTPNIKFARLNDAVKIRITGYDDDVTMNQDDGSKDTFIVLRGEVLAARGGDKDDNDQIVDSPVGEERAIWLRYRRDGANFPAPITSACATALKAVGDTTRFAVGGVLTVIHDRMGDKPKNPAHSRAKLFSATYTAPDPLAVVAAAPAGSAASWAQDGGVERPAPAPAFDPFVDS